MARPSSTKKVSRAAQTGGGRTTRGSQSWLYWAMIALIVVLGVAGIGYSRDQRRDELASGGTANVPPIAGQDHWHAAYGIYICDKFVDQITDQRDPEGIHTHGDGVIHIHPIVRRAAGKNATLSKFFDAVRLDLTDSKLEVPGKTYSEDKDKCDGKPGIVQLKVKGRDKPITTNIADFRFTKDREVLTIAFAPEGAEIPTPPSEPTLDNLSDVEGEADNQSVPPATNPDGSPVSTTPAESTGDTSTTAPATDASTTTTAAP